MKLSVSRFAIATCCFIFATVLVAAPPAPGTVTVGDFVVRLADALSPSGKGISNIEQAREFFTGRGVVLPSNIDFSASLTQADVKAITSLLGLKVNAQEPEKVFDAESVDGFVGFLREQNRDGVETTELTISALGACCCDGFCFQEQPTPCHNQPGCTYKGKGIPCTPDPCTPGKGVCCFDGDCSFTFPYDCPGVWRGLDSCNPGTCKGKKGRTPVTPTEP